ncbi:hypothetical protein DXX93_08575 [Thalassotalea euphylliae]|uniref:Uncharacterized protein n=1 Tax=Thalassotalea euphylliae TaxID=1655234 RepID=A0A3E0TRS2_9GAMM|nr:hypothetical protein [Thalassotalea euphylliae]REL26625.1 hypothetical protein DXX93_08575 [Thalassotalea euphylliae]
MDLAPPKINAVERSCVSTPNKDSQTISSSVSASLNHATKIIDKSYKHSLLASVWQQSRLIASLLDQVGLAYHRVFEPKALELFIVLINTELSVCYSLDNFTVPAVSELNDNLFTVNSNIILAMDSFVLETFNQQDQRQKQQTIVARALGKNQDWKSCPKSRFEQIICPVLEQKLPRKPHNKQV